MSATRAISGREEYDPIMKGREYEKLLKQYKKVEQAKREAENLQPLELITEAPEGYYYEAEGPGGYKEYNRQVLEYNKALREYKAQINQAALEVDFGLRSLRQFEETKQTYYQAVAGAAPQRSEFLQYVTKYGPPTPKTEEDRLALKQWEKDPGYREAFGEYLKTMGPPEPTEEQRRRLEAGLPLYGLPGPAAGPKPGSIGARVQPFIQEAVERMDEPFKAITQPMRETAESLEGQSLEAAGRGESWIGFAEYMGAKGINMAAAAVDIATLELRPQLWADISRTTVGITYDPDTRQAFVDKLLRDPFGAATEILGGAYFGGVLRAEAGKLPSRIRRVKARYDWSKYGDEALFTAGEAELGMQFPEAEITYEPTAQLYRRAQLTIYDKVGLVKEKFSYYIDTVPELERATQEILDAVDDWSPTRMTRGPDSYYALPFDDKGGAILVKGKSGMKPIKEPSPVRAPRSDAIQMATTEGVVSTPIKSSLFTQAERLLEYVDYEPISSYIKPVVFKDILSFETIRITEPAFTLRDLGVSASVLRLSDMAVQRVTDIQKTSIAQIENQLEKQLTKTAIKLESELGLRQPVTPAQIEVQLPKTEQVQIQKLWTPQIQLPVLDVPKIVEPKIPKIPMLISPPYKPPRKPFDGGPEEKKKKRGKRRKRGVYELRFDFPDIKLPKEPKL